MQKRPKRGNRQDASLVRKAQKDKDAFAELYGKYFGRVYGYILRRAGASREAAEDLAQETFARAFGKLSSFQSRGHSYLTYLLRISKNLLANWYRKGREGRLTDELLEVLQKEEDIAGDVDRKLLGEHIAKATAKLPQESANILRLYYQEQLSLKEIAQRTQKTQNAAKLLLSRSRKRLGRLLSAETPFGLRGVNKGSGGKGREKTS